MTTAGRVSTDSKEIAQLQHWAQPSAGLQQQVPSPKKNGENGEPPANFEVEKILYRVSSRHVRVSQRAQHYLY